MLFVVSRKSERASNSDSTSFTCASDDQGDITRLSLSASEYSLLVFQDTPHMQQSS